MDLINKMIVAALAALAMPTTAGAQANARQKDYGQEYIDAIAVSTRYVSKRPKEEERLFRSEAIEKEIRRVRKLLKDTPYLAWMFENCFPNTLDTTVHLTLDEDGKPDTFV